MNRLLLALLAGCLATACAMPEPKADTASTGYTDKEVITGSRIPAKSNASNTKKIEMTPMERDEMLRPKATPLAQ